MRTGDPKSDSPATIGGPVLSRSYGDHGNHLLLHSTLVIVVEKRNMGVAVLTRRINVRFKLRVMSSKLSPVWSCDPTCDRIHMPLWYYKRLFEAITQFIDQQLNKILLMLSPVFFSKLYKTNIKFYIHIFINLCYKKWSGRQNFEYDRYPVATFLKPTDNKKPESSPDSSREHGEALRARVEYAMW